MKLRQSYIKDETLPLISIVTPSFNQGIFIRETIESVLSQDYPNIQYTVIDGNSTDETTTILSEYSIDPRFEFISEEDSGQSNAINKGWRLAHGDILAWLCSDDLYMNQSVLRNVEILFRDNTAISVLHGRSIFIDALGDAKYGTHTRKATKNLLMRGVNPVYQPSSFIRRSLLNEVGFLREDLNYLMDFEYWLRLSEKEYLFLACEDVFSKYRVWENSKTFSNTDKFTEELLQILVEYKSPYVDRLKRELFIKSKLKFIVYLKRKYEWQFPYVRKLFDYFKLN